MSRHTGGYPLDMIVSMCQHLLAPYWLLFKGKRHNNDESAVWKCKWFPCSVLSSLITNIFSSNKLKSAFTKSWRSQNYRKTLWGRSTKIKIVLESSKTPPTFGWCRFELIIRKNNSDKASPQQQLGILSEILWVHKRRRQQQQQTQKMGTLPL